MINHAMFQRNERTGYVLKPPPLRIGDKTHLMQRGEHFLDVTVSYLGSLSCSKSADYEFLTTDHIRATIAPRTG